MERKHNPEPPFNAVGFIMAAEAGLVEEAEMIDGVQQLVNTGIINGLQGSWQRLAADMIRNGVVTPAVK